MEKPKKCCGIGTYEHTVPMPINRRIEYIDYCIADIVAALNAANIKTVASCCGHGILLPSIILEDGRWIVIMTEDEYNEKLEKSKGGNDVKRNG